MMPQHELTTTGAVAVAVDPGERLASVPCFEKFNVGIDGS
jgi:hypothetical protein